MYISKTIFLNISRSGYGISRPFYIIVLSIGFIAIFCGLFIAMYSRSVNDFYLYIALLAISIIFLVIGFHIIFSFFSYIFRHSKPTATTANF